jgi:hypothetical protein
VTSSESDGNANNNNNNNNNKNNASVDLSSEISDSELFPEDDTGLEYVGLTSESETTDYTSEGEDFPLLRGILKKKIKTRSGSIKTYRRKLEDCCVYCHMACADAWPRCINTC